MLFENGAHPVFRLLKGYIYHCSDSFLGLIKAGIDYLYHLPQYLPGLFGKHFF